MLVGENILQIKHLLILCFFSAFISTAYASKYYCVQVMTDKNTDEMRMVYKKYKDQHFKNVRIEKIGKNYVLRIGALKNKKDAVPILKTIQKEHKSAFIRRCNYNPIKQKKTYKPKKRVGFYCIQVMTDKNTDEISMVAKKYKHKNYPNVRIEKIGKNYVLRVGAFKKKKEGEVLLQKIRKKYKSAYIRRCLINLNGSATISPHNKIPKRYEKIKSVIGCPENKLLIQTKLEKIKSKKFYWEQEYKVFDNKSKTQRDNSTQSYKNVDNKSSKIRFQVEKYAFVDGHTVQGMKEKGCCRKKGNEIIGKLGLRLKLKLAKRLGLWGDVRVGAGYQDYIHSYRTKFWFDISSLYLLTQDPFEPFYPGLDLQVGRIPISETRGFWYRNSLDSIRVKYQSTLLNGFVLFGTRFNDSRISNSEERNNIKDYFYLIGNLEHQYYYNHYISLFLMKEYKDKSDDIGEIKSVWDPVKPDRNLNWIGLRLIGNKNLKDEESKNKFSYWGDIAYMWGENQFVSSKALDCCSAYKIIEDYDYDDVSGWGGEAGLSYKKEIWGLGARLAIGQGEDSNENLTVFFQPKTSNNKDKLFGPTTIRTYGELSNPDLTNLVLIGLFGGLEISEKTWLELNLLKYQQYRKSASTTFSKYLISPNGNSNDLGWEANLILEGEQRTKYAKWRYNVTGAYFQGGKAFDNVADIDNGYGLFLRIKRYW